MCEDVVRPRLTQRNCLQLRLRHEGFCSCSLYILPSSLQVGTFYPFFRGHAHLETQRREPWLFGEETTGRIRTAIRERYALLPYIYTLFRAANTTGAPVLRPLWYEFPHNKGEWASAWRRGPGTGGSGGCTLAYATSRKANGMLCIFCAHCL